MSYQPNSSLNTYNKACHVYLDIDITNNNIGTDTSPVPVNFTDVRSTAYLSKASDYFLSVVRWSIGSNLPIAIPQIQLPQTALNQNTAVYSFTMVYHTVMDSVDTPSSPIQEFLQFTPQNTYLQYPTAYPQNPPDILSNQYFYCDSVAHVVDMINITLNSCFNQLALLNPMALSQSPYFVYDEDTGKLTYYGASDFISPTPITPMVNGHYVQVYMNGSMNNWLNSLPSFNTGYKAPSGKNYLINFKQLPSQQNILASPVIGVDGATYYYYSLTQEYSSIPAMSPITSLVFTSSLIPIEPTNVSAPIIYGANNILPVNSGVSGGLLPDSNNANLASILTDFEVPLVIGNEYRSILYYNPTAEFRLFDLISNCPLQKISINVFWKDKIGNLHPMTLNSGQSATMKILMRKKEFNNIESSL